jgi:chloramphenicol 3-O-phosphotransferase
LRDGSAVHRKGVKGEEEEGEEKEEKEGGRERGNEKGSERGGRGGVQDQVQVDLVQVVLLIPALTVLKTS